MATREFSEEKAVTDGSLITSTDGATVYNCGHIDHTGYSGN